MKQRGKELCRLLGIELPLIQAPMAGANTPELAAAVAAAGGLGSLGLGTSSLESARTQVKAYQELSNRALNLNFFCHRDPPEIEAASEPMRRTLGPFYQARSGGDAPPASLPFHSFDKKRLEWVLELTPKVVSFHFGLPDRTSFQAIKGSGAVVIASATSSREARYLEDQGVDAVIAQGLEAGGHRGHFLDHDIARQAGSMALLPQIVDAVDLPVIAAGGITDGRAIAAAFCLGASAVQVGTAFLRCPEAKVSTAHRRALANADDASTKVTKLFSGRPARSIVNQAMDDLADREDQAAPYPVQQALMSGLRHNKNGEDDGGYASLWSGQSASLALEMPAGQLVAKLIGDARQTLAELAI